MKMPPAACLFAALVVAGDAPARGGDSGSVANELTAEELRRVASGEQVTRIEDVPGFPWPRVSVYQAVPAAPEEVAGVFVDYPGAVRYIPNLLKSEVSAIVSPCEMEVDYTVDIPVFPDEFYTVRNRLSALPGGAYLIEWKLVRAAQTQSSEGELRVEPFEGKSLMRYRNLTRPASCMAGLLRGKAIQQLKATVHAICREVARQKSREPEALARRVERLHSAIPERKKP